MPETVTNKSLNTGSVTNKEVMVETTGMTWDEADFTWDNASGTWESPLSLVNKPINLGSMSNKQLS